MGKELSTLDNWPCDFLSLLLAKNSRYFWTPPEEMRGRYSSRNTIILLEETPILYLIGHSHIDAIISLSQPHNCISSDKYWQYSRWSSALLASKVSSCPVGSDGWFFSPWFILFESWWGWEDLERLLTFELIYNQRRRDSFFSYGGLCDEHNLSMFSFLSESGYSSVY